MSRHYANHSRAIFVYEARLRDVYKNALVAVLINVRSLDALEHRMRVFYPVRVIYFSGAALVIANVVNRRKVAAYVVVHLVQFVSCTEIGSLAHQVPIDTNGNYLRRIVWRWGLN